MKPNQDEKLIKEILQKGTQMKAPKDLSIQILDRWQLAQESNLPTPVLPRVTWWILASTFASLFIWGFSKMSFPDGNSGIVIFMEQVLENIEYAIMGNEGIVFPTVAVLVIMVLINAFMLRFRIPQRRILGSGF